MIFEQAYSYAGSYKDVDVEDENKAEFLVLFVVMYLLYQVKTQMIHIN